MKTRTILASAYAVNPYKGSEDGMGWNFISQIARHNKVIAVTRRNNREAIERYLSENTLPHAGNMQFLYFDLPSWTRFWKKGPLLSMIYYYMWQLFLPVFVKRQKVEFDITHNLNFHNDWTPTFLWVFKKPLVWGPVGHHPKIPKEYILPVYGWKAYVADRFRWGLKLFFWNFDPFLRIAARKADTILCMNTSVADHLKFDTRKMVLCSSVATETEQQQPQIHSEGFRIISVGRFVVLKGFDITIRSFAKFYHHLPEDQKAGVHLTLVGEGPERLKLEALVEALHLQEAVTFVHWVKRSGLSALYAESDVFLFPSHEGAGMVVAEALSHGLPVLCFDNAGPGEFVNMACGMKVKYGVYQDSVNEFASNLRKLHQDRELLANLSTYARITFSEKFSWNVKGDLLRDAYLKLPVKGRVHCVHLMNDYSGSPLVLANAIRGFQKKGFDVDLYTSTATREGFLSGLDVNERFFWYRFRENKWQRVVALTASQVHLFSRLFFRLQKKDTVYVNTLLPFGAALAAKLRGVRVVYHLHETSINPPILKWFLKKIVEWTASNVVYVSKFLKQEEPVSKPEMHVVYNALSEEFRHKGFAHRYSHNPKEQFTVLMLCSLKEYKGVNEFVSLAGRLPRVKFELVLNSKQSEIDNYFFGQLLPLNMKVFAQQKDVHPFYRRAHLVLNLSHPDKWIETFGMTILEAMIYGIPELVPDIGGPVEIVEHGISGYRINVGELDEIEKTIRHLSEDRGECIRLSVNARLQSQKFSLQTMQDELSGILSNA